MCPGGGHGSPKGSGAPNLRPTPSALRRPQSTAQPLGFAAPWWQQEGSGALRPRSPWDAGVVQVVASGRGMPGPGRELPRSWERGGWMLRPRQEVYRLGSQRDTREGQVSGGAVTTAACTPPHSCQCCPSARCSSSSWGPGPPPPYTWGSSYPAYQHTPPVRGQPHRGSGSLTKQSFQEAGGTLGWTRGPLSRGRPASPSGAP